MPIYTYKCDDCDVLATRMSPIDERDYQICDTCLEPLERKIDRPGLVWAPTAGGFR